MPKARLLMHRARNRGVTGVKAGGGKTWYTTGPYINMEELKMSDEPALPLVTTEQGRPIETEDGYPVEQEGGDNA